MGRNSRFFELFVVTLFVQISGCGSAEHTINSRQAICVISASATVRHICFSSDGSWVLAISRKVNDSKYEESCFAYNIDSSKRVEVSQDIDSVCRWGNDFLSTTGHQIFSFSPGPSREWTLHQESVLSDLPLHMLGSGRMASNETTIAVTPVWIAKGDGGQAYIPSEKTVFGTGVEAERLRTALLKLEPKGIDIHCVSITSGSQPTIAITYPTNKAWQIAVLRLDADKPTWNTGLASSLPGYYEPMGDEPYDVALRNDGNRIAVVGVDAKQVHRPWTS